MTGEAPSRRITILGATGSVGQSTLNLIAADPERYPVEAMTACRNVERLARDARRHRARFAAIADESCYGDLKEVLWGSGIEVAAGRSGLVEAAERPAGWVMAAIVGVAGLEPTLAAVRQGGIVALATKECLVAAGAMFMSEVRRHGTSLLPVDSEHNAIFQALSKEKAHTVEKLVLTASGGPFRGCTREAMAKATPKDALLHPTWSMGAKISIDSATMMNKGLELIEAHHLFDVGEERIDVLIHPQSIIHSLVAFKDGSLLAQLGEHDMRIPIAYTLGYPARIAAATPRLDLAAIATLTFELPDLQRFPALALARRALGQSPAAANALNAANEVAVEAFLQMRIGFLDIAAIVEAVLEDTPNGHVLTLADVVETDREARRRAGELVHRCQAAS